jgi:RHS repeat-associated protein
VSRAIRQIQGIARRSDSGARERRLRLVPWVALCVCALWAQAAPAQDNKSGVSPQSVSLPSGAGSVSGLEGYDADLSTGTATFTIPLEVPAQSTGTTPVLELGYESGGGNSTVGFGWSLSYGWAADVGGMLQRRTSKALPRYVDAPNNKDDDGDGTVDELDEQDEFTAEGGKILVPLEDGYYFGLQEDSFYRYARHCNAPPECEKGLDAMRTPRVKGTDPEGEGATEGTAEGEGEPVDENDPGELACVDAPTQEDGSPCADGWDVEYPNGYGGILGQTENSRIVNPETGEVFAWLLDEEYDTTGNRNIYKYVSFDDERNLNQKYLQEIEIVDFTNWSTDLCNGTYPWTSYRFVYFVYEDREDMFESCESGFPVRTGKRLKEIYVGVQGVPAQEGHAEGDFNQDGVADWLARRYVLDYGTDHFSQLVRFTHIGCDNVSARPSMTMQYTPCNLPPELDVSGAVIGVSNAPRVLWDSGAVDLTELNGDGLADLLKTEPAGGLHTAYMNLGETEVDGQRVIAWSNGSTVSGDQRTRNINLLEDSGYSAWLNDMNADGIADLVYDADETYWFEAIVSEAGATWGERTKMNLAPDTTYPPSPFSTDATTYEDLDGNERADVMQSISVGAQSYYRIWYNQGGEQYSEGLTVTPENGLTLRDEGAGLEDFNGDGLPDLVRVLPAGVEVSAGLGYGYFAPRILAPLPDFTLGINQAQEAGLEDITGDGLPDLVIERAEPGVMWYWVNRGDYAFQGRRKITGLPTSFGATPSTRWADMNGNGTSDLVYADRFSTPAMRTIDIGEVIGCVPAPNMLTRVDNGFGAALLMEYTTSLSYQKADEAAGSPWPDPMPEIATVIASKTETDGFGSEYVTRYVYHDGFYKYEPDYDFFSAFARVEEITEGGEGAPGVVHKLTFDVGREDPAFRGNLIEESYEDEAGAVFWKDTTVYAKTVLFTGVDGRPVQLVRPSSSARDIYERGQGTPRRIEQEFAYDEWGNTTFSANYGVVEGGDRSTLNDETITRKIYTFNCRDWLVEYVSRAETFDLAGNRIRRDEIFYDNETYIDDAFRFTLFGGNTLGRSYPDPNDLTEFVQTIRIKYDLSGNTGYWIDGLSVCDEEGTPDDELGHYRVDAYEDFFQNFLTQETNHVGGGKPDLVATYDYDYGHGTLTAITDFSGNVTRYKYDVFGRLIAIIRPGDSDAFPTEEYEYGDAIPIDDGFLNYVETRLLDTPPNTPGLSKRDHYAISRLYADGLGREWLSKTEAEPDLETGTPRVVVTGAGNFSPRGNVSEDFTPYFTTIEGDTLDELLAYEDIAADGWTGAFVEDGEIVAYGYDDAPRVIHEFDPMLREIKTTSPDGAFVTTIYEPLRTTLRDENDNDPSSTSFDTPVINTYDGQERLIQVDELVRLNDDGTTSNGVNTWSTKYSYRADGLITEIIDAQNNVRTYTYDGLGRQIEANDPDTGISTSVYDLASNEVGQVDGKDLSTLYTYDGANRLLTVDIRDEGEPFSSNYFYDPSLPISDTNRPDVAYFYDEEFTISDGQGGTDTTTNAGGRVSKVLDQYGTFYYGYEPRGQERVVASILPHPSNGAEVTYLGRFTYDQRERIDTVFYPDGDRATYTYTERGFLSSVIGGAGLHADGGNQMLYDVTYTPTGKRWTAKYGDGTELTRKYDQRDRLVGLRVAPLASPDTPHMDYRYAYDAANNLTRVEDLRPEGVHASGEPLRNTHVAAYDDAYRMTSVEYFFSLPGEEPASAGTVQYRYDRLGNLISQVSDLVSAPGTTADPNLGVLAYGGALGSSNRVGANDEAPGPHLLTSVTNGEDVREFVYDDGGSLSRIGNVEFAYDHVGRIVQAESPSYLALYTYDFDGYRLLRRVWNKAADGTIEKAPTAFVQYIGDYYDIREGEDPIKYVYDGEDTLALVRGSMDAEAPRTQRFLASEGWNLFAMAVDAPDAMGQLQSEGATPESIFLIDALTNQPVPATAESLIPPGTAFWLWSPASKSFSVTGDYEDNVASVVAQQGFVALARIGANPVLNTIPDTAVTVWAFNADEQSWRTYFGGDLSFLNNLDRQLTASTAFYVKLPEETDIEPVPSSWGIEYYHGDHLTSSNIITDAVGNVIEETTFFPFGESRARTAAPRFYGNPYQYINRERDAETGLMDFEARYLVPAFGRFVSADPVLEDLPMEYLQNPQLLNPYSYSGNNPLTFYDPQGRMRERANKIIKIFNPYNGISGAANVKQKRDALLAPLQLSKGAALPDFNSTDNFFKRAKVKRELIPIKAQYGSFDLEKFLPLNRKLNQLSSQKIKIFDEKGQATDTAIDVKPLQDFLFGGTGKVKTKTGKNVQGLSTGATAQIQKLNDEYLKKLDLNAEFDKLKVKGAEALKKQDFKFKQEEADNLSGLLGDPTRDRSLNP